MKIFSKISFSALLFLVAAETVRASQLADLPPGQPITFNVLNYIISRVANFIVIAGVLFAVIFIVWGGITYMAAGSDSSKVDEAKERIKNGIIGTAVVMGVGVIINTIVAIVTRDFFCQFQVLGICLLK